MTPLVSPPASSSHARRTMQANPRAHTKPERLLRSELHRRGLRFRVDVRPVRDMPCRADIVLRRHRIAVFVDGCFWHRCPLHSSMPRTNVEYWEEKFARNVARDRRNSSALRSAGWHVLRFWEHEDVSEAADRVIAAIAPSDRSGSPASWLSLPAGDSRAAATQGACLS